MDARWKKIEWARRLLRLPPQATRDEIRRAYRSMSRRAHPDSQGGAPDEMTDLNRAYRLLMDYVEHYNISFEPNEAGMTGEQWWMHHFGQDPVWGGESE